MVNKRSNFPKIERNLYQTWDPRAIRPLIPHLPKGKRYAECCAGAGALIKQLRPHAECAWAADIHPLAEGIAVGDALTCELGDADFFCTNPPWPRPFLHRLIVHLSDQAQTFLLFQSNWANTQQAEPYLDRCRKIIAVGRLRWIPETTMDHTEDVSWYEFGRPIPGSNPVFYGYNRLPAAPRRRRVRICRDCSRVISPTAKWVLALRDGVSTPVHRHCDNPDSYYAFGAEQLPPAPLLDFIGSGSGA